MGYNHFEGARGITEPGHGHCYAGRRKLAGDWTSIQGNFGPPGGHVDVSGLKRYADYHDLLADPDIDLVDICLPTDQHFKVVMESIAAGKATLVEKPISVSSLRRADGSGRSTGESPPDGGSCSAVLPGVPVCGGRCGIAGLWSLRAAHFRRVICRPNWSADMSDFRKLGGWGIDLHIHDNHFIAHAFGRPSGVFPRGCCRMGL